MKYLKSIIRNITIALFASTVITASAQTKTIKTVDGKTLSIETLNTAIKKAIKQHNLPGFLNLEISHFQLFSFLLLLLINQYHMNKLIFCNQ